MGSCESVPSSASNTSSCHLPTEFSQPPNLHIYILITVQPPRSTRSLSLITLAYPSIPSSLRITDRFFQYASPRLWNQLPAPLRQPRTSLSNSGSPSPTSGTSSIGHINSPHSSFITPSLFHSRFKTFLFCKSFHRSLPFFFSTDSTDSPDCLPILLSIGPTSTMYLFFTF